MISNLLFVFWRLFLFYLSEPGIQCVLGGSAQELREKLVVKGCPDPVPADLFHKRGDRWVALAQPRLPDLPADLADYDCRNNRLAASAIRQIKPTVDTAIDRYGSSRVAVVMGTSTSGIAESERAVRAVQRTQQYPAWIPRYPGCAWRTGRVRLYLSWYHGSLPIHSLQPALPAPMRCLAPGAC